MANRDDVHIKRLKRYVKKYGKAKTAVVLRMKETSAINNWLARGNVPNSRKGEIKELHLNEVRIHAFIATGTK